MSASQLRCLIELLELNEEDAERTSTALAAQMRVSKPTVHRLLSALCDKGLARKEHYGRAALTEEGLRVAVGKREQVRAMARQLRDAGLVASESAQSAALLLLSGLGEEALPCLRST